MLRVIDLNDSNSMKEFNLCLRETGFAILKNHNICLKRIKNVYNEWMELFKQFQNDSKLEEKNLRDPLTMDGYYPLRLSEVAKTGKTRDIKEYYQIYLNGKYPENVSKDALILFEELISFGKNLLENIEVDGLKDSVSNEKTMMRILHYPSGGNANAHEDINWITLLPMGSTDGLELKIDNNWIKVPYNPEYIVINVGDMLQEFTNGLYKSTTHRVLAKGERMSIPCFIHPHENVYLSDKYPSASIYLNERLNELKRFDK